ncbi:20918_t:CDS:2 [Dentiscutata erythropus]|uniref:20918_t:CDS:1 n=1 Tax=Dentiscutata erythropus TaxID=1348616 RepID=A0A9N9GAP0_9GLOM|nr:20918_t:CDS:2 [Dentiscutata erythropus]
MSENNQCFRKKNTLDSQALQKKFKDFTRNTSCKVGDQALLPLVLKSSTSITCDTIVDQILRIQDSFKAAKGKMVNENDDVLFNLHPFKKKSIKKRNSLNTFSNTYFKSRTESMLVYEQQNNKFDNMNSVAKILEDLNMLEKETNPDTKYWKRRMLCQLCNNKEEAKFCKQNIFTESYKRKLVVIAGATGDIGFNIAKAFLKYGYKKYAIKVIRHANSEYLEEKKLKRENRAKRLEEEGAGIEQVDYNKHDKLVEALAGVSFVVSALGIGSRKPCYNAQINPLKAVLEINERFEKNEKGIKRIERFVPSEFYADYTSIAKEDKEIITDKALWYVFEDKKDFYKALETRKFVKKTEIMYVAWLGFDTTTRDSNFYAERDKKVTLTSFADIGRCVVELLDNHKFVNKAIRVNGISLTLGDVRNKFVAIYKKFVADTEWSDMYHYDDITSLNAIDNEGIKVLQARNLDLGPGTLTEKELGFKLDNDLDRVIEIFIRTNSKEQLDLSHLHEFPELLSNLFI